MIAEDDGPTGFKRFFHGQSLEDDFGSDTRRITHRDADLWKGQVDGEMGGWEDRVMAIWVLSRFDSGFGIWHGSSGIYLNPILIRDLNQSLISMMDFSFNVLRYCLNAFSISLSK
jgi:hypothetical protein